MNRRPNVGDTVRLNDHGIKQCFGSCIGLAHMKSLTMKIVWVDQHSITEPEKTYVVNVDNGEIDNFLIDNWCFDLVKDA